MRLLVPLLLLVAATPTVAAGCLATVHGLCVEDPTRHPCDLLECAIACPNLTGMCLHYQQCVSGNLRGCIELEKYCLHANCPDPGT